MSKTWSCIINTFKIMGCCHLQIILKLKMYYTSTFDNQNTYQVKERQLFLHTKMKVGLMLHQTEMCHVLHSFVYFMPQSSIKYKMRPDLEMESHHSFWQHPSSNTDFTVSLLTLYSSLKWLWGYWVDKLVHRQKTPGKVLKSTQELFPLF